MHVIFFDEDINGAEKSAKTDTQAKNDVTLKCKIILARQQLPVKYVTVPGKRDHLGNFFKIELLLPQGRVGFELQNALHI